MTFNKLKIALASSALVALSMGSTGAQAATDTATATANILEVVTVTQNANLNFGTIVPDSGVGATSGTVAISAAGTRTCAANLVCSLATTAAGFDVTGSTGQTVDVSVPASVTLNGGGSSMSATLSGSAATIVLDGTDAFTVGGTLTVGVDQTSASYTGTFTVTVDYQ